MKTRNHLVNLTFLKEIALQNQYKSLYHNDYNLNIRHNITTFLPNKIIF